MTSDDKINEYIREALEVIIDNEDYFVIKADQNAPRPNASYCTVKITASKSSSLEEYSEIASGLTDNEASTKSMRSIRVAFNFFKNDDISDPFYMANLCRQALARYTIIEQLERNGLGLGKRGSVKNLTFELDSGFEERAQFIAEFNYVDTDSEVITTISTVSIEGEYQSNGRIETFDI